MILQTFEAILGDYIWILGLGISVGLAFLFMLTIKGDEKHFLGFLTLFLAFSVWGGLLDMWFFVASLTIFIVIVFLDYRGGKE